MVLAGTPVFIAGILLLVVFRLTKRLAALYSSPLRRLRGPPSNSRLYGNSMQVGAENAHLTRQWVEQYGLSFCGNGLFNIPCLWTADPRAINHVITRTMDYIRPIERKHVMERLLGQGLVVSEGEVHDKQRRVMNPAFGPAQIRELTEIFLTKANELCTLWNDQIIEKGGCLRLNVVDDLDKITLDVIGLAGFDYDFGELNPNLPPSDLSQALHDIFKKPEKLTLWTILGHMFPLLRVLNQRDAQAKKAEEARMTMRRIAKDIVKERKAHILRKLNEKSGGPEKRDVQGRDLLSLLIKANIATDIPENQRMTDEEVVAQIPTFFAAGNETTSTVASWCLFVITRDPAIQRKLREELFTLPTDSPTMDQLNSLPYLDQVMHETLRLYAPVLITYRLAARDDVLPVSEPYKDRDGKICHEICVSKGDRILVLDAVVHTSKAIWGEDALEFKPERWDNPPAAASDIPGLWGHLLAFLGGPRSCIGYRFALVEIKAIIFTLMRTFEFELAAPVEDIVPYGMFMQHPCLRSESAKGAQLPLLIRPHRQG